MIAHEEKQFVLLDRPTDDATELVSLQGVARGGEEVPRVKIAVAQEFEQIAVKFIRAGFCHGVYYGGGMISVLRGHGAGFHLEFLERVREGQRKRQIVVRILMQGAVEQIATPLPWPPATDTTTVG